MYFYEIKNNLDSSWIDDIFENLIDQSNSSTHSNLTTGQSYSSSYINLADDQSNSSSCSNLICDKFNFSSYKNVAESSTSNLAVGQSNSSPYSYLTSDDSAYASSPEQLTNNRNLEYQATFHSNLKEHALKCSLDLSEPNAWSNKLLGDDLSNAFDIPLDANDLGINGQVEESLNQIDQKQFYIESFDLDKVMDSGNNIPDNPIMEESLLECDFGLIFDYETTEINIMPTSSEKNDDDGVENYFYAADKMKQETVASPSINTEITDYYEKFDSNTKQDKKERDNESRKKRVGVRKASTDICGEIICGNGNKMKRTNGTIEWDLSGNTFTLTEALFAYPPLQNGVVDLTDEEKRSLIMEGFVLPLTLPLKLNETKCLKKIRRKLKNRMAAQESRRKQKEYLDQIENEMEHMKRENINLKEKLSALETKNKHLTVKIETYQNMIRYTGMTKNKSCLMIFALFFAMYMGGSWTPHPINSITGFSRAPISYTDDTTIVSPLMGPYLPKTEKNGGSVGGSRLIGPDVVEPSVDYYYQISDKWSIINSDDSSPKTDYRFLPEIPTQNFCFGDYFYFFPLLRKSTIDFTVFTYNFDTR